METISIREKLHHFIEVMEDKKAEAIYTLFEDEIENDKWEYPQELKAELDNRYEYYKNGGKMISAEEADIQINEILQHGKFK